MLHENGEVQPDIRYEPIAKLVRIPEDIPPMKEMLSQRKERCIHCHDVKAATLRHRREIGQLRKDMVFTYPSPRGLGIRLDPEIQSMVHHVNDNSPAMTAEIRAGDLIRMIDNQRVLTFADATRVLELAPKIGELQFGWERDQRQMSASVQLPSGWRKTRTRLGVRPLVPWGRSVVSGACEPTKLNVGKQV